MIPIYPEQLPRPINEEPRRTCAGRGCCGLTYSRHDIRPLPKHEGGAICRLLQRLRKEQN